MARSLVVDCLPRVEVRSRIERNLKNDRCYYHLIAILRIPHHNGAMIGFGKRRTMAQETTSPGLVFARRDVQSDLRAALGANEFFLVYQPTIDLQTGAFSGVEALIRWRHPVHGVISPDVFIPELEDSGLIMSVGRWALFTACAQGAMWHDKGYRFNVSVNTSNQQLDNPAFVQDVDDALASSGFDAGRLVLEFSLAAVDGDVDATLSRLAPLKDLQVRVAIDDIVPSDATLSMLEKYPIDVVKLDRTFISDMSTSSSADSLVRQLVLLAKSRGVQIIASGVEDPDQRRRLQIDEINGGQGFLFSKPHEPDEIDRFLEDFAIFSGEPL
jgi:EAL domain-containing protein (putative c-di-GMP-specific phosphodiesterase class I)